MSRWTDDGDYWTCKGKFHKQKGGKWRISVKKNTIIVLESILPYHAETIQKGTT